MALSEKGDKNVSSKRLRKTNIVIISKRTANRAANSLIFLPLTAHISGDTQPVS
jgi:chemotaxis receptor (MCP) glutamine deamidase CheD